MSTPDAEPNAPATGPAGLEREGTKADPKTECSPVEARPADPPPPPTAFAQSGPQEATPAPPRAGASDGKAPGLPIWRLWPLPRVSRVTVVAVAVALGAAAGSAATAGLQALPDLSRAKASATDAETRALAAVARLDAELTGLKAALDQSAKSANAQFARVTDRLDRAERGQAEPAAKLARITEAIERIERRATADTTGSTAERVVPPAPVGGALGQPVVQGWVLRNVYDGAALLEGRRGLIEVEPGDRLPGGGRVEAIRRQDGRWVVVTSKGVIIAAQRAPR